MGKNLNHNFGGGGLPILLAFLQMVDTLFNPKPKPFITLVSPPPPFNNDNTRLLNHEQTWILYVALRSRNFSNN
jgi:hypothetical protein